MTRNIIPVILSGGSGTRLWPVSRRSYPKQFWPLIGEETLIQQTALRGCAETSLPPLVICNAEHRFIVAEQLRQVGVPSPRIVLEPEARNSGPAIAAAAALIAEETPDAIMWVMAADALIEGHAQLQACLAQAVLAAERGYIATFGIVPTRAETGYGYIEPGARLSESGISEDAEMFRIRRFTEKPQRKQAEAFFRSGQMLWNSGMFVAGARTFLDETKRLAPDIWEAVVDAVEKRRQDLDFERLDAAAFARSPSISVDYAIAEKTDKAVVVKSDFRWSDIGSWDAVWDALPKDAQGNASKGDVVMLDSRDCFVRSDGPLIAMSGLKDIMVIATEDAVAIAHRDHGQQIRQIVSTLEEENHVAAASHRKCYRPWGSYTSLAKGAEFQVKQISVDPGAKLSLQKHLHRAEHWVVVSGVATVTRDQEVLTISANESIYIPVGTAHRLENANETPLIVIEVQTGTYLEEDDIIRLDDIYARLT